MKTCKNCYNFKDCPCGNHGWCVIHDDFFEVDADADDCECYAGEYTAEEKDIPHYQTETERDNPRDPIIERR
mgnify:CR=1 FL=1